MRRVAFMLLVVIAGCGSNDAVDVASEDGDAASSTATTEIAAGPIRTVFPPILVAWGSEIIRVQGDEADVVGSVEGKVTVAYGDGVSNIQAVQVDGKLIAMVDGSPMQLDPGAPGAVSLFDLVSVDGAPHALYGVLDERPNVERSGPLILGSITGKERRDLGTAFAPEFSTFAGSIGGDLVAVSAFSDLTESVDIFPLVGSGEPNPWSPTTELEYNAPPLILDAILAPDGDTIAWLSGPDHEGATDLSKVGTWEIVVAELGGNESHRIALESTPRPSRLDYDGARLLISREGATALLIDLADGATHQLPVPGVATFDG